MTTAPRTWLTVREAATELGCSDAWVRDLARRKQLRSRREYGVTVVSRLDVLRRKANPPPPGRRPGQPQEQPAPPAARPDPLGQARRAIREAVVESGPERVVFSPQALDRAYELLIAAEPRRKSDSICGGLSVGFGVRGEDYDDAPDED